MSRTVAIEAPGRYPSMASARHAHHLAAIVEDVCVRLAIPFAEVPPTPCSLAPDLPQPLCDLVMRLIDKDPSKRVASAVALSQMLREV